MKEQQRELSVSGRDDWFKNPLTWLILGCVTGLILYSLYIPAVMIMLLLIPANLVIEYESTKRLNTNPNKQSDTNE